MAIAKLVLSVFFLSLSAAFSTTCPVYFKCDTGAAGLGDQLEHFVYCMYCAKLLNATVVSDGLNRGNMAFLRGGNQYGDATELLGLHSLALGGVHTRDMPEKKMAMSEVLSLHEKLRDGSIAPSCGVVYTSDIYSCPGHPLGSWCDLSPVYDCLKAVVWSLRSTHAREKCFQRKLGFHKFSPKVNIVWHVRVGDVCLHCEAGYFIELFALLKGASPAISSSHHLVFESQSELPFLHGLAVFENATFNSNSTIAETICNFLTSDVLITSGSSFSAFIAAFSKPWSPVVFEERRKEAASRESTVAHHFLNPEEAILMEDGRPTLSTEALSLVLESVIGAKMRSLHFGGMS